MNYYQGIYRPNFLIVAFGLNPFLFYFIIFIDSDIENYRFIIIYIDDSKYLNKQNKRFKKISDFMKPLFCNRYHFLTVENVSSLLKRRMP
jgi:hypothetical protein